MLLSAAHAAYAWLPLSESYDANSADIECGGDGWIKTYIAVETFERRRCKQTLHSHCVYKQPKTVTWAKA
jgi:hypothetical protein